VTWPSQVPFADCRISPAARRAALDVLASGWVTTGPQVAAFEDEFAAHVGARHAVAVSSCTAAIELALRSLKLPPGSRVLISTLTFCGAVQAILHAGQQPVLVDVSSETGMPTEATTRAAVEACGQPAAMVVLHWAGDPADVAALAAAAGLPLDKVIEDAAHGLEATLRGRTVGSAGTACFSFYATKNLPLGEGGMVTCEDQDRADWIRRARLHGMSADAWRRYLPGGSWRYDVRDAGLKANMTDLQAAIGREQLPLLPAWQERRARLAARYDRLLVDVPEVSRPHRPDGEGDAHAWHLYPVRVWGRNVRRDDVVAELADQGIGTSVHFIPVHHLTYFRSVCTVPSSGLAGADHIFEQLLSLPLYPSLRDDQVDRVAEALRSSVSAKVAKP
jgi:dTDP-4-amino-4,6-dideoxygalactose transaminase